MANCHRAERTWSAMICPHRSSISVMAAAADRTVSREGAHTSMDTSPSPDGSALIAQPPQLQCHLALHEDESQSHQRVSSSAVSVVLDLSNVNEPQTMVLCRPPANGVQRQGPQTAPVIRVGRRQSMSGSCHSAALRVLLVGSETPSHATREVSTPTTSLTTGGLPPGAGGTAHTRAHSRRVSAPHAWDPPATPATVPRTARRKPRKRRATMDPGSARKLVVASRRRRRSTPVVHFTFGSELAATVVRIQALNRTVGRLRTRLLTLKANPF